MADKKIGFFERYLTVWVFLCIIVGIALGHYLPGTVPGHWQDGDGTGQHACRGIDLANDNSDAAED